MLNELWWAQEDRLAGMRKPTSIDEVNSLKPRVSAIISLLDDEQNHDLYREANMPFLWLPVTGGKAPTAEQVSQACQYIEHNSTDGKAVAVHCSGGRKRTATLIASVLTSDLSADEALGVIAKVRPDIALNPEQIAFIKSL